MLRQETTYIASAMPAASFLASKEIPLIQSDNGRGGPTPAKEKKAPAGQNLPVLRASLQGLATGKFCTAGLIYRCFAFDVTDSVYSQTQDTAPTRALLCKSDE